MKPLALIVAVALSLAAFAAPLSANDVLATIKQQERALGGRLGVYILDTETGTTWQHRADDRFPLMSTFKTFACAAMLQHAENGQLNPEKPIPFTADDLVVWSPETKHRAGGEGMSLNEFCAATLSMSDNSAANMILSALGGPSAVTDFFRSIGDNVSRLDRIEPALNEATPGDKRDTTTPLAIAQSLQKLLLGNALPAKQRPKLTEWMKNHKLGADLFRKHLPTDWQIAERTGAGEYGSRGYTAVIWPSSQKPIVVAIYLTETNASMQERNQVIATIGAALISQYAR